MSIRQFFQNSDHDSQRDLVGLAIYYLESYGNEEYVTSSMIRDIFEIAGIPMSTSAIAARLHDMSRDNIVMKLDDSGRSNRYVLSLEGFGRFEKLAGDEPNESKKRTESFINTDVVDAAYYRKLVDNINKCYREGVNDATMVLTRKLFENLIIDILRAEYGGPEIELYYNTEIGRFHGLGALCESMANKLPDLKHYSRQLDKDLLDRINEFREEGNSQAHSIRVDIPDDELRAMTGDATEVTEILYIVREEVRIANG